MQTRPLSVPCVSDDKAIASIIPATKFHPASLTPNWPADAGVGVEYWTPKYTRPMLGFASVTPRRIVFVEDFQAPR